MLIEKLTPPWRTAAFLLFAGGCNYADRSAFTAVLPALQRELALSSAALGLLGSLFLWSYAVASPLAGWIGDRFPRRTLVLGSLVAWSVVTLLTGFARSYEQLAALRIALGLAECVYIPTAVALLGELHGSATRGRAFAIATVGIHLGATVGGTVGGVMADQFGWRSGFWVLGAAGIGLALAGHRILGRATAPATAPTAPRGVPFREPFACLARTPLFVVLVAGNFIASIGTWAFLTWLPMYLTERYRMSLGESGFYGTFTISLAVILGASAGGWLSDRVTKTDPRRRMLIMVVCSFIVAPCMWGFMAGLPFAWLAFLILGMGFVGAVGGVNVIPLMCDAVPPRYHATAQGIMNTVALAAGGLGVVLTGVLKPALGLDTLFAARSGLVLLVATLYLGAYLAWLRHERPARKFHSPLETSSPSV